jgi:hypothetical protein
MRVKAVHHKKAVACSGCGKSLPAACRSFYLPHWKGGGAHLCGRCGMNEMKKASRERDDTGVVQEPLDLSAE